jgi:hypothetical protein
MPRRLSASIVTLLLATAIHTDWHFARPVHHRLSLGIAWHWLLAIPAFALAAWYVARVWPLHLVRASLVVITGAVVIAGVLEPAFEYFVGGALFEWTFGAERTSALAVFVATGVATYLLVMVVHLRRRSIRRA